MVLMSILIAYLLGSISSSTLVGRWFGKIDIRQHGSGNAGATNTLRVLGLKWALVVLAFDVFKGILAVLVAAWTTGSNDWAIYLAGIAVIAGHNWPVFFRFRGGKGVATTIGVLATTMFGPAALAGVLAIVVIAVTGFVSLGSMVFTVLTPVFAIALHRSLGAVVFLVVVAALSVYRHRSNVERILRGQESRLFRKKF